MKKPTLPALITFIAICAASANASAATNTSKEYKAAYACAMEAFTSGYGSGPAAFCVGNSRDPSPLEIKAYRAAESDFRNKAAPAAGGAGGCTFAYATYIANGSHADGFEEGLQRIETMKQVAHMMGSREISLFDKNNQPIPAATAAHWFKKKSAYDWVLTPEAAKTCTRKQIG